MKATIKKDDFLKALSDIKGVVEARSMTPVLTHFLLEAGKDGCSIQATNMEFHFRGPLSAQVQEEGTACIPARKLLDIVRELEETVSLESRDNGLRVNSGNASYRVACLSPEEFPRLPEVRDARSLEISSADLLGMIERTAFAAATSDTRYALQGVLFHVTEEGSLTLVGTDGHRMAVSTTAVRAETGGETKAIIPKRYLQELRKFLQEDFAVTVLMGKNHVLFRTPRCELLSRLIEGVYPNYQQVIPATGDRLIVADRAMLDKTIKRARVMSNENSRAFKLEAREGKLTLSSSHKDLGEASDSMEASCTGEPVTVGFNSDYLRDGLARIDGEKVAIHMTDPLSPALVTAQGEDTFRYVVMPLRLGA